MTDRIIHAQNIDCQALQPYPSKGTEDSGGIGQRDGAVQVVVGVVVGVVEIGVGSEADNRKNALLPHNI